MKTAKKFAVITGASTGIGYELAKIFISEGYDLMIAADGADIVESAQALQQGGADVQSVRVDLATHEGCDELANKVEATGRAVDALVLNAGFGNGGDFVRENTLEQEMRLIGVNVMSPVHIAKRLLPAMVERGEGRVLITSSIAALMPGPFYATYAASKAFDLSFSEALANELRDTGVTVTALMPGPTDTDFFIDAGMLDTPAGEAKKDDPAQVARQGFEAMMKGEDHVIGGAVKNKLQGFATRFLTEPQKAAIHRNLTQPNRLQDKT